MPVSLWGLSNSIFPAAVGLGTLICQAPSGDTGKAQKDHGAHHGVGEGEEETDPDRPSAEAVPSATSPCVVTRRSAQEHPWEDVSWGAWQHSPWCSRGPLSVCLLLVNTSIH